MKLISVSRHKHCLQDNSICCTVACVVGLTRPWRRTKAVIFWSAGGRRHAIKRPWRTVWRHCHFFQEMSIQGASSACFRMTDEQVSFKKQLRATQRKTKKKKNYSLNKKRIHVFKWCRDTGTMMRKADSLQQTHLMVDHLMCLLTLSSREDVVAVLQFSSCSLTLHRGHSWQIN